MRRRFVLVVSCGLLLPSAVRASAECAWVLWGEAVKFATSPGDRPGLIYVVGDAHPTRDACEAARETKAKPQPPVTRWVCLPDTVDPRFLHRSNVGASTAAQ